LKKFKKQALGAADDSRAADGKEIFSYFQAKAKAEELFKEWRKEARRAADGEPAASDTYTVGMAMADYFANCDTRGVKGLAQDERRSQAWIRPTLGDQPVAKLTRRGLDKWLAGIAESGRRVRTGVGKEQSFKPAPANDDEQRARRGSANRIWAVLRAALNYALDRGRDTGVIDGSAWRSVQPFKGVGQARTRILDIADQVRLVNACPPDFRRLVRGALLTGARYGELARVKVGDFDREARTLWIAPGKTDKSRYVALTDEGVDLFTELCAGRPGADRIFLRDQVSRRNRSDLGLAWGPMDQTKPMARACKSAGLEPLGFHQLRHSYASMLLKAGVPVAFIAAQLGHSNTRMVETVYGHLHTSALVEAIRKLAPRLGITTPAKVEPLKVGGGV
jgi:integrase